jgi:hypothetical protein
MNGMIVTILIAGAFALIMFLLAGGALHVTLRGMLLLGAVIAGISAGTVIVIRRRRYRGTPGLDEDPAVLTLDDEDAWKAIRDEYSSTASERVYAALRKPWWRRRHRGHVVVVKARWWPWKEEEHRA